MKLPNKSEKLDKLIFGMILILFFLVSLVPFFALKQVKIMNFPAHYLIIGGCVGFLVILTWFNQQRKFTTFDKWLLMLVIGLSASLISSVDRLWTLRSLASFFLRGIGVAFIMSRIIDKDEKKNFLIIFLLSIASIVCIIGLIEFFTGKIPFFHKLYLKHADYYPIAFSPRSGMVSTIGHPLPVSAYLILLLPLSIWFSQNKKNFFKFVPFFLIFLTILLSFSRSSWVVALFAIVIYFSPRKNFQGIIKKWKTFLSFLIIFILPFLLVTRIKNVFSERFNLPTFKSEIFSSHRSASYKTTLNILKKYPLFGVGMGNYPKVHETCRVEGTNSEIGTPDNMYLRLLSETGIIGTSIFISFLFFWFIHFFKTYSKIDEENRTLFWAIISGLVGFLVNLMAADFFYWLAPQFLFWFLLGFAFKVQEAK